MNKARKHNNVLGAIAYLAKKDRERKARENKEKLQIRELIISIEAVMIIILLIKFV